MNSHKFIANGWTADLPEGWEDRSMITLVGATDASGFAANIIVTRQRVEPETNIEEYARIQSEMMQNEVGALQILDRRAIEIGGLPSFQCLQRFESGDGRTIQQVQTFFLNNETVYTITGTAALENFDGSIPAFKKFVETFKFDKW
jgi:hypothetical protein